jgi:hypothetical protein
VVVAGLDAVGIQSLAQEELPAEAALWALRHQHLVALDRLPPPFGRDGEHVLLHRQLDGRWVHARDVEVHHEAVLVAVGVHSHDGKDWAVGLLHKAVEFTEKIESHKHGYYLLL